MQTSVERCIYKHNIALFNKKTIHHYEVFHTLSMQEGK